MVLSENQAYEIYQWKQSLLQKSISGTSVMIASRYNVSPKTVRDIWNRRTWCNATRSLWSASEVCFYKKYTDYSRLEEKN